MLSVCQFSHLSAIVCNDTINGTQLVPLVYILISEARPVNSSKLRNAH